MNLPLLTLFLAAGATIPPMGRFTVRDQVEAIVADALWINPLTLQVGVTWQVAP